MRMETGLERTWKARACLSCPAQMLYSFCGTRVTVLGRMLPWQLLAAQPPAPLYLPTTVSAARTPAEVANKSPPRQSTARISVDFMARFLDSGVDSTYIHSSG